MAEVQQEIIEAALKSVADPYMNQDLMAARAVKKIAINGGKVGIEIMLGYPARGVKDALAERVRAAVAAIPGVVDCRVRVDWKIETHGVQRGVKPLANVIVSLDASAFALMIAARRLPAPLSFVFVTV